MKKYIFLLLTIISTTYLSSEVTTSVIVPCTFSHIKHLPELIESLNAQTVYPDEVVISISQFDELVECNESKIVSQLKNNPYPYILKILTSKNRYFPGTNRNIAIENSCGDIIICQDADDIAHPQRIELIKKTYEETSFNLLIHNALIYRTKRAQDYESFKKQFLCINNLSLSPNISDLSFLRKLNRRKKVHALFKLNEGNLSLTSFLINEFAEFDTPRELSIHCGNCAFHRNVYNKVPYSKRRTGQDLQHILRTLSKFNKCFHVSYPLVLYVHTRSTYYERLDRNPPK